MNNSKIELDRETVLEMLDVCNKAIAYEESQRGHYEITYTTKHVIDTSIRDIWKLKYRLKNLLNDEKEKENEC